MEGNSPQAIPSSSKALITNLIPQIKERNTILNFSIQHQRNMPKI
jgi:hypothetical protein